MSGITHSPCIAHRHWHTAGFCFIFRAPIIYHPRMFRALECTEIIDVLDTVYNPKLKMFCSGKMFVNC
ncbi:hypothetical protein M5D96_011272 [Drosophila gunungcola]|uniref:Uncharacterized protein n=1 Tax=Drosophila gunungcola TaxID=103775 RepID=A0A9Q0BL30_9MUSC|nr:hypothetical protein M5D96_011272 [Drosophila gunungcola]